MKSKALKIAGIAVAALVVLALMVPLFVNADSFRPTIEARLRDALGRQVQIGKLSLSLFSGSVKAENLAIADDPAFSREPFVRAKSIGIGVELMPLIFSKKINITSLVLDQPHVVLLQAPSGTWNFSSMGPGKSAQKPATSQQGPPPAIAVGKLRIKDGQFDMGKTGEKPQSLTAVNIDADNVSTTSAFPFKMTAALADGGKLKLEGKTGPIDATNSAQTPFEAAVSLTNLDLAGYLGSESGLAGKVDYVGKARSDGQTVSSQGSMKGTGLVLAKGGSPAPAPIVFNYATDLVLKSQSGTLRTGDLKLGNSVAKITGTYDAHGKVPAVNLRFNAPGLPVGDLQALLPSLGVTLPKGASLQGGTVGANLNISGPLDRLVITGPIQLADTRLAGFNMGSKMSAISALTGANTGSDTVIQHLNSAVRLAPEGIALDNIDGAVQGIGTLIGNGTVSASKALDFRMSATLAQGSAASNLLSAKGLGGSIPFLIRGTASDPQFVPDTSRLAQSAVQNLIKGQVGQKLNSNVPSGLQGLTGLFGGKKKKP